MSKKAKLNLYKILGVPKKATYSEIRKAYYNLAKEFHPDKNNGKESPEFIDITTAFSILKDREKRKEYDKTGDYDFKVYDIRKEALAALATLFLAIVKNKNWEWQHSDLFSLMTINLKNEITKLERDLTEVTSLIYRLTHIEKRISGKDSLFNDMIKEDMRNQKALSDKVNESIKMLKEALSILKDYEYHKDDFEGGLSAMFITTDANSTL